MSKRDGMVSRAGRQEDDVLVEKNGTNVGAYTLNPLGLLPQVSTKKVIAVGTGVGANVAAMWALKKWGNKIGIDNMSALSTTYLPLVGGVVGALACLPLTAMKRGGKEAAATGAIVSIGMGLGLMALKKLKVISGMGALVMQPLRGGLRGYGPMGALPQVRGSGYMPGKIRQSIDKGVWGKTWA